MKLVSQRTGLASLAGPFLVKHHDDFRTSEFRVQGGLFNDGRGCPARLQRVGAVGRAAGADAARENPAQVSTLLQTQEVDMRTSGSSEPT